MNRNHNKSSVVTTLVVLLVCLVLVTGSTFSLFTSDSKVNIAVTAGDVELTAIIDAGTLALYSKGEAQTGKFANDGTAAFNDKNTELTLTNITPGDSVVFNIVVENESTVDLQYRVNWIVSGELAEALEATVNDADITSGTSEWTLWKADDTTKSKTLELAIELPLEADDNWEELAANIAFNVEAVQANATGEYSPKAFVNTAAGLQAAIDSGATEITLNDNIDLVDTLVFTPATSTTYAIRSTPITLNLNGKTLSLADKNVVRNDGANIVVENGTIVRTGDVAGYAFNNAMGALELNNVTINGGLYTSGAALIISDSTITQPYSGRHAIYSYNCATTINSGIFHNDNSGNSTIMAAGSSVVTINGGEFSINDGHSTLGWTSCLVDSQNGSAIVINDGTFNGGFRTQGGSSMTINNGSFNDVYGSGYNVYTGATVTVNGGVFTDSNAISYANKYVKEDYEIIVDENGNGVLVEKINEVVVTTVEGLLNAFAEAEPGVVINATGVSYSITGSTAFEIPAGITLVGLKVTANYRGGNYIVWGEGTDPITFENCTFGETSRNILLCGSANGPTSVVYNNCTFTGQVITNFVDNADGVATFNNCVFTKAANSPYNFIEGMGGKHIFNNCTFDYTGVSQTSMGVITNGQLNVYSESDNSYSTYIETNGCQFINCGKRQYGADSTLVVK